MFDVRLSRRQFAGLGVALASAAAIPASAFAQATPVSSGATQMSVTVTAVDFAFEVPDNVPSGYVQTTLVNQGKEIHQAQIVKIKEGFTFDQMKSALDAQGPGAIAQMIGYRGGPNAILPGGTSVTIDLLTAGTHALICYITGADGIPHYMKGMIKQFEVTGEGIGGEEPTADVNVTAMDFSYNMPDQVTAGHQIWEMFNNGPEPHELALMTLTPDIPVEQVIQIWEQISEPAPATPGATPPSAPSGPPPFAPAGGLQAIDPGIPGWLVLDLQPGRYLALCNVPDPKTGKPHFELGMYKEFNVVAAAAATPVASPIATPVS